MLGLLEKARRLRDTIGSDPPTEDNAFAGSGMTREEQREIRAEIEKVATSSRIAVKPEMFAVRAARRGVLFPVLVNIGALVVLAAGLALFYFLFQRGETQLIRENAGTITAEGKLIEQVRKESEAKLQEKNQQISAIQGQLADIDKQRKDLQTNMDARVQEKESELRAAMAAQLDAERARLERQGLSDQDIEKKLADLQTSQNAAFTRQLDDYRAQAEAERKKTETTLTALQTQFNADLAKASTERQQVLDESRQREQDLQAQLAQKTKELQSAQAQTQQQLATLQSQKQQEDLVSQQLVGLYSVAQTDIASKNLAKALTSLQAIASYVSSADVMSLPGIAKRRSVDLFLVDSLTSLVQGEIDRGKQDTSSLVDAAGKITDVRAKVTEADGLLRAGRATEAETLYSQALATIPEIGRSYAFFTTRAKEAEAARQETLRAALARAEAAFNGGQYTDMLAAYRDALAYLPEGQARIDAMLGNIGAAASSAAQRRSEAEQSLAASSVLTEANALADRGDLDAALERYLALLGSYPRSTQASDAARGVGTVVAAMNAKAADASKAQEDRFTKLAGELNANAAEILRIKTHIASLIGDTADPALVESDSLMAALDKSFADTSSGSEQLRADLASLKKSNDDLQAQVALLTTENEAQKKAVEEARQQLVAAQQAQADAEKQLAEARAAGTVSGQQAVEQAQKAAAAATADAAAEKAAADAARAEADAARRAQEDAEKQVADVKQELAKVQASVSPETQERLRQLDALIAGYRAYVTQEDQVIASDGEALGRMKTIGFRDSFLSSLNGIFAGVLDRVHRYDDRFISDSIAQGRDEGRQDALEKVTGVIVEVGKRPTPDQRRSFLEESIKASDADPQMQSFLRNLQSIIATQN
ncbi:MAG TPA: hypothetical protein VHE79_07400 [Spirochaetia bacterium]